MVLVNLEEYKIDDEVYAEVYAELRAKFLELGQKGNDSFKGGPLIENGEVKVQVTDIKEANDYFADNLFGYIKKKYKKGSQEYNDFTETLERHYRITTTPSAHITFSGRIKCATLLLKEIKQEYRDCLDKEKLALKLGATKEEAIFFGNSCSPKDAAYKLLELNGVTEQVIHYLTWEQAFVLLVLLKHGYDHDEMVKQAESFDNHFTDGKQALALHAILIERERDLKREKFYADCMRDARRGWGFIGAIALMRGMPFNEALECSDSFKLLKYEMGCSEKEMDRLNIWDFIDKQPEIEREELNSLLCGSSKDITFSEQAAAGISASTKEKTFEFDEEKESHHGF